MPVGLAVSNNLIRHHAARAASQISSSGARRTLTRLEDRNLICFHKFARIQRVKPGNLPLYLSRKRKIMCPEVDRELCPNQVTSYQGPLGPGGRAKICRKLMNDLKSELGESDCCLVVGIDGKQHQGYGVRLPSTTGCLAPVAEGRFAGR